MAVHVAVGSRGHSRSANKGDGDELHCEGLFNADGLDAKGRSASDYKEVHCSQLRKFAGWKTIQRDAFMALNMIQSVEGKERRSTHIG